MPDSREAAKPRSHRPAPAPARLPQTCGVDDEAPGLAHYKQAGDDVPDVDTEREVSVYRPRRTLTHVQGGRPEGTQSGGRRGQRGRSAGGKGSDDKRGDQRGAQQIGGRLARQIWQDGNRSKHK